MAFQSMSCQMAFLYLWERKESQNILHTQRDDKELLINFNFHVLVTQHYNLGEHFGNSQIQT